MAESDRGEHGTPKYSLKKNIPSPGLELWPLNITLIALTTQPWRHDERDFKDPGSNTSESSRMLHLVTLFSQL